MVDDAVHTSSPYWKLVQVWDGDTVDLESIHGERVRFRLWGLDAPEHGQMGFRGSRRALVDLLKRGDIAVNVRSVDRYGRNVAKITVDGHIDVTDSMVRGGWAWWYQVYCPREWSLMQAERDARERRVGIWQYDGNIEPWLWRRGIREKQECRRGRAARGSRRLS